MKVIVDIKNKTLKMLENERSIFKGEYSADKLELYINQQLENEYPVITGLLSNGRRIGAFTTDDGYEIETIDGVEYTKAKFTLSKENGFPLSAGVTQITIWMYRTKDSVLVSKEAIGNVVFTVVDTTAFNDGDVIISGDVEGTVVNLKVEVENLQSRLEQYLPLSGAKAMTGNLEMKGNNIIFDNNKEDTLEIGEEDDGYSMSIRMEDTDYYKGRYRASGFSVGNDYIDATLDISESKFEMSFKDGGQTSMRPDGFSANKEGTNTTYEDGKVTRYTDNYSKIFEYQYPNESGTLETKENVSDLFAKNLTKENLSEIIKDATQSLSGLMSSQDKKHLDTLAALLEEKENDNVVNTINEILAIFNQYPEGVEILSVLSEKLNKNELLPYIEEHSVKSKTIEIGSSTNCNFDKDTQIPTSKAVGDNFQKKLIQGEGITIDENNVISLKNIIDIGHFGTNTEVNEEDASEENIEELGKTIRNQLFNKPNITIMGTIGSYDSKFIGWYDTYSELSTILILSSDKKYQVDTDGTTIYDVIEKNYGASGGLYTQYLKVNINDDNDIMRTFTIILNTFKPITTLDEFRDYIRNRLIYSDTPTYITTTIHFMELGTLSPIYLAFSCGYYGTPSCSVQELTTSDNTIVDVLLSTNISVVLGRITDFEVLATIKG